MPLRKYLSLGKRWVLERCNLLLKAVFSRLPIQNRVFFYSIRADGKLLENSQCVYDALGNVQKVVVARMLPHPVLLKPKIYYYLLTSRVIVTDDYLRYLRHTKLRAGQKVVQIWHGLRRVQALWAGCALSFNAAGGEADSLPIYGRVRQL